MSKNNIEIKIYGGNNQVIPDVKEVEQHIYTENGQTQQEGKQHKEWNICQVCI